MEVPGFFLGGPRTVWASELEGRRRRAPKYALGPPFNRRLTEGICDARIVHAPKGLYLGLEREAPARILLLRGAGEIRFYK